MKKIENSIDEEILDIFKNAEEKKKNNEDLNILEGIFTRRSVRNFTGKIVDDKTLLTILKAGSYAPSAKNKQPWHFIVVKNKEILEQLSQVHPYIKMVPKAGCAIVVCGNSLEDTEEGFIVEGCSAAIQNILLAAHGLNLGAVWCGIYPISKCVKMTRAIFNLEESIIPIGVVAIGHTKVEESFPDRFNKDGKIHYETW